jgi:hypothetical protein
MPNLYRFLRVEFEVESRVLQSSQSGTRDSTSAPVSVLANRMHGSSDGNLPPTRIIVFPALAVVASRNREKIRAPGAPPEQHCSQAESPSSE